MRKFEFNQLGKIIIINLEPGEALWEGIRDSLADSGVKNAILVSGIGSLRKFSYHIIGALTEKPEDLYYTIDGPVEIGCMQGIVAGGVPHIHVSAASPTGEHYIGHLEPGSVVQYLGELVFIEVADMDVVRVANQYGMTFLEKETT